MIWGWVNTVTGLVWSWLDTVIAQWVPALGAGAKGNRGEHWDSERGNGSRRGAAESRQKTLLSPQSLPKLQEMDVKTTAAGECYP